jgi:hypothetical protein
MAIEIVSFPSKNGDFPEGILGPFRKPHMGPHQGIGISQGTSREWFGTKDLAKLGFHQ